MIKLDYLLIKRPIINPQVARDKQKKLANIASFHVQINDGLELPIPLNGK